MAQQFVRDRLKAPSTAEFPWKSNRDVMVQEKEGCTFHVQGFVDAENGFGAQLRTFYEAELTYQDNSDGTWTLNTLQME